MSVLCFGKGELCFGADDLLLSIQSAVAGEHIAYGNCDQIVIHAGKVEKFKADQQGGDGAVGNAAEYADHSAGGNQFHRQS